MVRIIHAADPHGDMEAVEQYAKYVEKESPDVAFLTGDLIHSVFSDDDLSKYGESIQKYNEQTVELLKSVQSEAKVRGEDIVKLFPLELFEAVKDGTLEECSIIDTSCNCSNHGPSTKDLFDISKNPDAPLTIQGRIHDYFDARDKLKDFEKLGKQGMESQYKEMFNLTNGLCFYLPGNHDGKCLADIVEEDLYIHKKAFDAAGMRFAAYGSAQGIPTWIPEELLEPFMYFRVESQDGEEKVISEAGKFMLDEKPEIAVLHETPLNDEALRIYATKYNPSLVLCGHIHENVKIYKLNDTTHLVHPGKLGETTAPTEDLVKLRTFTDITLGDKGLEKVLYNQIKDGKIEMFSEYKFGKEGNLKSAKFSKEYGALLGAL